MKYVIFDTICDANLHRFGHTLSTGENVSSCSNLSLYSSATNGAAARMLHRRSAMADVPRAERAVRCSSRSSNHGRGPSDACNDNLSVKERNQGLLVVLGISRHFRILGNKLVHEARVMGQDEGSSV